MKVTYRKHHRDIPEAHLFLDNTDGACAITLQGSVSMSQEELDYYGEAMAEALSKLED